MSTATEFDPPIDLDVDPKHYERKEPHDEYIRRGKSPFWLSLRNTYVIYGT